MLYICILGSISTDSVKGSLRKNKPVVDGLRLTTQWSAAGTWRDGPTVSRKQPLAAALTAALISNISSPSFLLKLCSHQTYENLHGNAHCESRCTSQLIMLAIRFLLEPSRPDSAQESWSTAYPTAGGKLEPHCLSQHEDTSRAMAALWVILSKGIGGSEQENKVCRISKNRFSFLKALPAPSWSFSPFKTPVLLLQWVLRHWKSENRVLLCLASLSHQNVSLALESWMRQECYIQIL